MRRRTFNRADLEFLFCLVVISLGFAAMMVVWAAILYALLVLVP